MMSMTRIVRLKRTKLANDVDVTVCVGTYDLPSRSGENMLVAFIPPSLTDLSRM